MQYCESRYSEDTSCIDREVGPFFKSPLHPAHFLMFPLICMSSTGVLSVGRTSGFSGRVAETQVNFTFKLWGSEASAEYRSWVQSGGISLSTSPNVTLCTFSTDSFHLFLSWQYDQAFSPHGELFLPSIPQLD